MRDQLLRLIGFGIVISSWYWMISHSFDTMTNNFIILLGPLISVLVVIIGRLILQFYNQQVNLVNSVIHYTLMVVLGSSIIKSLTSDEIQSWNIGISSLASTTLLIISGIFLFFTVLNLALKGLGAPFAIISSSKLASEWLYMRTRNPMVLALFFTMISLGLYLDSWEYLLWVLLEIIPFFLIFLKMYEEKELEIRFGDSYLDYKKQTPFLFPKILK